MDPRISFLSCMKKSYVNTITEATDSVECWHFDDESENIIYEGI